MSSKVHIAMEPSGAELKHTENSMKMGSDMKRSGSVKLELEFKPA